MGSDGGRRRRAAARADWPVRRSRLGEEPPDELSASTTVAERLSMMWPLAVEAWTLAGRELPTYTRAETPIRVVRNQSKPEGPGGVSEDAGLG